MSSLDFWKSFGNRIAAGSADADAAAVGCDDMLRVMQKKNMIAMMLLVVMFWLLL